MKQVIVIYNSKSPESIKKKFNFKQENPNAMFVNSNNSSALKAALKGKKDNVINFDDKLDLRKVKGDTVKNTPKKKAVAKKKATNKKKVVAKKAVVKKK